MKESDLFLPIKKYFTQQSFEVDGEVSSLDMLCIKEDEAIAIELKNQLNLKLILQGIERQKTFENVYLGVWKPKNLRNKAFMEKVYLLKRLGLGLIFVGEKRFEVTLFLDPVVHPIEDYRKRNVRKKKRILSEMNRRKVKNNLGGVNKEKIITAYKEDCLKIVHFLGEKGPSKVKEVREAMHLSKAQNMLYDNHYGWFLSEKRGIYQLSEEGAMANITYQEVIEKLKEVEGND
ncbi:MAG: hypothetical protein JW708_05350 [Vallitaleaceae bacterium]|nr:hypothetical protein [Vallitaleaceae bacterium]